MTPATAPDKFQVVDDPPRPDPNTEGLEAQLTKLVQRYDRMTKSSRRRRHYIWTMLDLFAKGLHFIHYDANKVSFEEWDAETVSKCMYTPVPLVEQAVETIAAQYLTSKPHIVPSAPAEDRKTKAVVRDLQTVADALFSKFYVADPEERQREAKLMPVRNIVWNFLEYDKTKGAEYEVPQLAAAPQFFCADCGSPVDPQQTQMPVCPQCGSQNIETVMGAVNQGNVNVRQGEIVRHTPDPFQVEVYDRRGKQPEGSPYLIYDEILFKTEAKALYPYVNITGRANLGNWSDGYCGLHYMWQIETLISNTGRLDQSRPDYTMGYGGSYLDDSLAWRRRVWIDKQEYSGDEWTLARPTQLPGTNQLVPAGSKLADMFPEGLVVHFVNGVVAKLENQDKNTVWSCYKYRVPSTGLYGQAVAPLVSLNRGYDELTSFQTQAALMNALGITLVDERVQSFENVAGQFYWVTQDARMPGEPLDSLMTHRETGGPSQSVEALRLSYRQHIADASMSSNPNASGLDREGMNTAHGVEYQASVVDTVTAPVLQLFAGGCAKVIQQAVQLEKKFNLRPRFYSKYGETTGLWFNSIDIPNDVSFVVAEESYQPRTLRTQRADLMQAKAAGIGIDPATGALLPALQEKGLQVFGLDADTDDYAEWAIKAEKRLDAMKSVAPQVEAEPADPEQAAMTLMALGRQPSGDPTIEVHALAILKAADAMPHPMDNAGMFVRFWNDVYVSDEYDDMTPAMQKAIELVWTMHQDAGAMMMAQANTRQVAAAKPQHDAMKADAEEQEAKAQGSETEGREANEQSAEAAHGRDMEKMDKEHGHRERIANIQAQAKKEIRK